MLKVEQIEDNKNRYIELLRQIDRPNSNIEELIKYLEESDFFTAPATTNSFGNYEGGLCEVALNRYTRLISLYDGPRITSIHRNSILITSLLVDLGKINYFDKTIRNKKIYHPSGKKHDEMGDYDWVSEIAYTIKEPQDRYIFGTLGQNAERIITNFIPLSDEESAAIINLHADYENPNLNIASIYFTYPLSVILTCADKLAVFIDSKEDSLPF